MFILVYVHLLQLQRPRSHIRAIRNIRVRLILKQQSRVRLLIRVLSVIRVRHSQATEFHGLIRRFAILLPVSQWVYDKSRVLLKTPLRVLTVYPCVHTEFVPKTQQASLPNEAGFIGT